MIASSCSCFVSWPMTCKERKLVAKLVGHINKSKKQTQQQVKLRDEVHSLDETIWKAYRDNRFLAETLQEKLDENDSLTKTLREKLEDLKKALKTASN